MKNNLYEYHIQDSRNIREVIKEKIVDVIITSPPYWNLKDYGIDNQIGFGQKYEKYLEELIGILDNCTHILKDNGSMWVIVDSFKQGGNIRMLPFEIADRLQKRGWHLQDIIIWQKDKTLPWSSKGKLRNIFEYVLFFTKSNSFNFFVDELRDIELTKWWPKYPERYNPKGKVPSRVWEIPIPQQGWGKNWVRHFCPFPPKLIENILLLTTKEGDIVLDPFAGSGSVLAQSTVMKRKSIGFDLNSQYKSMYNQQVLPFFENLWQQREKDLDILNKKRAYLEKCIKELRQLKFIAVFIKTILNKKIIKNEHLKGVVIIGENNPSRETKADYFFIFRDKINKTTITEEFTKIINNPEFKKFSLSFNLHIIYINEIKKQKRLKTLSDLWVYKKGVTNFHQGNVNFNYWINQSDATENKFPTILSNLRVNQRDATIRVDDK